MSRGEVVGAIGLYVLVVAAILGTILALRVSNPAAFAWGAQLTNLPMAAIGTALLLVASLAATMSLRSTRRPILLATLTVAAAGCMGFAATILVDQDAKAHYGIRAGSAFAPNERYVASRFGVKLPRRSETTDASAPPPLIRAVSASNGRKLFLGTCASCHGVGGEGMPGQGKPFTSSEFIAQRDDAAMLAFLKVGRQPWDPLNTTKVQMPPRGGNPMLTDDDLRDVLAFVRTLNHPAGAAKSAASTGESSGAAPAAVAQFDDFDIAILAQRWVVPSPPKGPAGLSPLALDAISRSRWQPPDTASSFATAYVLGGQFASLHAAVVGLVLLGLMARAARRSAIAADSRPLALTALGCWCSTVLWLVVFAVVYV
ncbi:MAG: cytochrome c [Phycisphaerae bacterium]